MNRIDEQAEYVLKWIIQRPFEFVTTRDVADNFEWSLPTARRHLSRLADAGYLTRGSSRDKKKGVWHRAKDIPKTLILDVRAAPPVDPTAIPTGSKLFPQKTGTVDMNPFLLARLISKWTTEQWQPIIFKTLYKLPLSVADLIEYVDGLLAGEPEIKGKAVEIKGGLTTVLRDIDNLRAVVAAIHDYQELWTDPVILTKHLEADRLSEITAKLRAMYTRQDN